MENPTRVATDELQLHDLVRAEAAWRSRVWLVSALYFLEILVRWSEVPRIWWNRSNALAKE